MPMSTDLSTRRTALEQMNYETIKPTRIAYRNITTVSADRR